jgi:hypothetical protein
MGRLNLKWGGEDIKVDEFYKSLLFQRIMDTDFGRDERDVMLVIFRKTVHYDKWYDRLPIYHFSQLVGITEKKLKSTIKQLEAKSMIEVERSKGGRGCNESRFNMYSLSTDFVFLVAKEWRDIKENNGFDV